MKSAFSLLFSASLIASAAAHGWIGKIVIGGKTYEGNKPTLFQPTANPSVVRQIADNLPVKDVTSADLTCGRSAQRAALVATAKPGDAVSVYWNTAAGNGFWFHDVGPMMTYLASCGSKSCADFDASNAKWFKISEQGQDATGAWAQAKLDDGSPASFTLPSNLKAGNYLLRHEIIALHTAQSLGGAEFYPDCAQITVSGDGTGVPTSSELVSLPGAYKAADSGILIDVYNMKSTYQFPGPPVAAFVSGGSSAKDVTSTKTAVTSTKAETSSTAKAATHTTTKAATTATTKIKTSSAVATTSSASKTCKNKRSRRSAVAAASSSLPVVDAPVLATVDVRRSRARARHVQRGVVRSGSF